MLNEKPTFLSKIRTVSCGDILWAFFSADHENRYWCHQCVPPCQVVSLSPNMCHHCVNPTQGSCQVQCIVIEISNKISTSDVEFINFLRRKRKPSLIFLKNFLKKWCEIFIQNFQKFFHVGNFAWKFQVCDCVNWTFFGLFFFLDSLSSIFHVMQVSVISSLF